jgi:hypothetical protein
MAVPNVFITQVFRRQQLTVAQIKAELKELQEKHDRELRELEYNHEKKMSRIELIGGGFYAVAAGLQLYSLSSASSLYLMGFNAGVYLVIAALAWRELGGGLRRRRDLRVRKVIDRMGV